MTSRRDTRHFAEWSAFFFSASGGKKENPAIGGDPHGLVLATGQQAYHDRVSGKKHGKFHAAAEAGKRKRHTQRACLLTSHTAFAAQYKNTPGVTRWEHKETYALLGRCGLLTAYTSIESIPKSKPPVKGRSLKTGREMLQRLLEAPRRLLTGK